MSTIRCHFDGKVIVPDEPVDLPVDQPMLVNVEPGVSITGPASGVEPITADELSKSEVIGMWADRDDITDSAEFARQLRKKAESRGGQG